MIPQFPNIWRFSSGFSLLSSRFGSCDGQRRLLWPRVHTLLVPLRSFSSNTNNLNLKSEAIETTTHAQRVRRMVIESLARAFSAVRQAGPHYWQLKEIFAAFGITAYLVWKIPITEEMRAQSKNLHPDY